MKPLYVKCPHCKEVSELFLGSEAYMIVLNCPSCNSALMYYYGKTFEIDESEIEKIQGNLQMTTVQGILKNISARETTRQQTATVSKSPEARATHKAGAPVRDIPLIDDDITNLKIELALTKDVNDFIGHI
jgi:ribosomal protein S27E